MGVLVAVLVLVLVMVGLQCFLGNTTLTPTCNSVPVPGSLFPRFF